MAAGDPHPGTVDSLSLTRLHLMRRLKKISQATKDNRSKNETDN